MAKSPFNRTLGLLAENKLTNFRTHLIITPTLNKEELNL